MSTKRRVIAIGLFAWGTFGALGMGACTGETEVACHVDDDCEPTGDPCNAAVCQSGYCGTENRLGTAECECIGDYDCDLSADTVCFRTTCEEAKCISALSPPGAADDQIPGDCTTVRCDGTSRDPMVETDPGDVPEQTPGDCQTASCDGMSIVYAPDPMDTPSDPACGQGVCTDGVASVAYDPDGTACDPSGLCFEEQCLTGCVAANPSACGGEGPGEPANDDVTGAASGDHAQCGFLDATDVDWFTFYAKDEEFVTNILRFDAWSSASTIELCAYVKCTDGTTADGGCTTHVPGPDGSVGCCWSGSPQGFHQSWDLDCGTIEDSGEVYVSLRSTTASACESYAIDMSY